MGGLPVAAAAEQQSVVSTHVSANMKSIAEITKNSERSTFDISKASENLAFLAGEPVRMAEWLKLE